jgi:hypothetical protein
MSPAYDVCPFLPLVIMQLSLLYNTHVNLVEMPAFQPNDYLFAKHADKGKEKWEIFAWAVREAMADATGLKISDQPLREKMQYEVKLGMRAPEKAPNSEQKPLLAD